MLFILVTLNRVKGGLKQKHMNKTNSVRIIGIIALALIAIFSFSFIAAEEVSSDVTSLESEIETSLNEDVSGFKIGWEKFKLGLTFNQEKKAMNELKIARMQLVRARIAARNNNSQAMNSALEAHDRILERARERLQNIQYAGEGLALNKSKEKMNAMQQAIEVHELRIQKLNDMLANDNLTEVQIANIEARLAHSQQIAGQLKTIQERKRENLKIKIRAVENKTDDEAQKELRYEDQEKVKELKAKIAQKRLEIKKKVLEKLQANLEKAKQNGANATGLEQRIETLKSQIANYSLNGSNNVQNRVGNQQQKGKK